MPSKAEVEAADLMLRFAERTGLSSDAPQQRYLWTDAYAVCNFLALAEITGKPGYTELALELVDQVHQVLGRERPDAQRSGWISGLSEAEGKVHPTRGGLRIGKSLPERSVKEPFDDRLEWDRDGQYFHYLTKWMHALDAVAAATQQAQFTVWACELAVTAHRAFTYGTAEHGGRRMLWKMSVDLSRPLVPSMGHHDALDGFITCLELQHSASLLARTSNAPSLEHAVADFASMLKGRDWTTADPLGLGGLLDDAARVAHLMEQRAMARAELLHALLGAALEGLADYARQRELRHPAALRLAFRELGLARGLSRLERLAETRQTATAHADAEPALEPMLRALMPYVPLSDAITAFWLAPAHRQNPAWAEHRDINEVMLATALLH